jgi:hypothetical protein
MSVLQRVGIDWDKLLRPPTLTQGRIRFAYGVAIVTDALQFMLGPLGWAGADEALDAMAMALTWATLGFHPLLLPTFALEFIPFADMLPTWTACVALVVARRKQQQPPPPVDGPVIDV